MSASRRRLLGMALAFLALRSGLLLAGGTGTPSSAIKGAIFERTSYVLSVFPHSHWGIRARSEAKTQPFLMLWPWPASGGKDCENLQFVSALKDARLSGTAAGHSFVAKMEADEKETRFFYEFEAAGDMRPFPLQLMMSGKDLVGKRYEWGTSEGVPEGVGYFSSHPPRVDAEPAYFSVFDLNGRTATIHFKKPCEVTLVPHHWQRYDVNATACYVVVRLSPPDSAVDKTIPKQTRWTLAFSVTVE